MSLEQFDFYFSQKQHDHNQLINSGSVFINGLLYTSCANKGEKITGLWDDYVFVATGTMEDITMDETCTRNLLKRLKEINSDY